MLIDRLSNAQQAISLASILVEGEITKCYLKSRRKNKIVNENTLVNRNDFIVKTTRVKNTFTFLEQVSPYAVDLSKFAH